jgi:hypothetical protein
MSAQWKFLAHLKSFQSVKDDTTIDRGVITWRKGGEPEVKTSEGIVYRFPESLTNNYTLKQFIQETSDKCPFRAYCSFIKGPVMKIQSLELWMHPSLFLECMSTTGTFAQEDAVIELLHISTFVTFIPAITLDAKTEDGVLCDLMKLEQRVANGCVNHFICNESTVKLLDTGWEYHKDRQLLRPVATDDVQLSYWKYRGAMVGCASFQRVLSITQRLLTLSPLAPLTLSTTHLVLPRATLIVAPQAIYHLWDRLLLPGKVVVRLRNWKDMLKTPVTHLQAAHVVLFSSDLLNGKRYNTHLRTFLHDVTGDVSGNMNRCLRTAVRVCLTLKKQLDYCWPLECFHWKRVIMDCGSNRFPPHHLSSDLFLAFTREYDVSYLHQYLSMVQGHGDSSFHSSNQIQEDLLHTCFLQVQPEEQVKTVMSQHWVDLTLEEKKWIHASNRSTRLAISASTYIDVDVCRKMSSLIPIEPLDRASLILTDKLNKRLEALIAAELWHVTRIQQLNQIPSSPEQIHRLERQMYQLLETQGMITQQRKKLEYFQGVVKDMTQTPGQFSQCPVCYEADACTLVICGHTFCLECFSRYMEQHAKCPVCKCILVNSDVVEIYRQSHLLQPKYGSKFHQMFSFLKQCRDKKEPVVVMTSYPDLLKRFHEFASQEALDHVTFSGNPGMKQKALASFTNRQTPMMLLLEEKLSTGVLIKTHHVVWMHKREENSSDWLSSFLPVTDKLHCHSFLSKDTIEEST